MPELLVSEEQKHAVFMTMPTLYPLLVERHLVHRIWGGQRIADWLSLPEPRPVQIGESWQVFDTNYVINGMLSHMTLGDITRLYGADLVGTRTMERYGADFPLLTKFLDSSGRSSIQVHPNDDYAHTYEALTGFHGKSEAWYVLNAAPGATVVTGLKQPCSREQFAEAVATNRVEELLHYLPVQAGDTIFIPAGIVHNINAGVLLFEIQQKSDLTYRVYDYGRIDPTTGRPRDLHLDKAMDVISFNSLPRSKSPSIPLDTSGRRKLLTACEYFALEEWRIMHDYQWSTDPATLEILTVIDGVGTIEWAEGRLTMHPGDSVVLPATLGDCEIRFTPASGSNGRTRRGLRLLRTYVPAS